MKTKLLSLLAFCTLQFLSAQSKVVESIPMESKILGTEVLYSVYLPYGYDHSNRSYPVVYLLNGFTGDETNWIQFGNVQHIADEETEKGNITEMIIIMPDGDDRLYMNHAKGNYNYEDMFIQELIPHVESLYRIRKDKQYRAISGLSMGGAGALRLALKYDHLFGACAAFSSAVFTENEIMNFNDDFFDRYFGNISDALVGARGKQRLTKAYLEYDVFHLIKNKDKEKLKTVKLYFDCGDDDFLAIGNATLHILLKKEGIPHEYRVRDGAHTWPYWRASLPAGLGFISKTITR